MQLLSESALSEVNPSLLLLLLPMPLLKQFLYCLYIHFRQPIHPLQAQFRYWALYNPPWVLFCLLLPQVLLRVHLLSADFLQVSLHLLHLHFLMLFLMLFLCCLYIHFRPKEFLRLCFWLHLNLCNLPFHFVQVLILQSLIPLLLHLLLLGHQHLNLCRALHLLLLRCQQIHSRQYHCSFRHFLRWLLHLTVPSPHHIHCSLPSLWLFPMRSEAFLQLR